MPVTATGILVGDTIHLDAPLNLPDQTPVTISVQRRDKPSAEALTAWEATKARLQERPIHGEGRGFTRDELHERH